MRIALGLAAVAALMAFAAPRANADDQIPTSYCTVGDYSTCGFTSLTQCMAATNGLAAFCEPDYTANDQSRPRVVQHRKHSS